MSTKAGNNFVLHVTMALVSF